MTQKDRKCFRCGKAVRGYMCRDCYKIKGTTLALRTNYRNKWKKLKNAREKYKEYQKK